MAAKTVTGRFPFDFDLRYRLAGRAFGIGPGSAGVVLADGVLTARLGPWYVTTPVTNVATAEVTGPYSLVKTVGPPHLSLRDGGLTFATNGRAGTCMKFMRPVSGIEPLGIIRHRGLTVTVADPEGLAEAVALARTGTLDPDQRREELEAHDRLVTLTASELRGLAREQGVEHPTSLRKDELVDLLERELGARLDEILPADGR